MRYFFEISYKGSNYHGWQSQPNAIGIQTVVEDSLSKLIRSEVRVVGSGRTDTGVHCEQQFFHADLEIADPTLFLFRINSILPKDIAIHSVRPVTSSAHARYDAVERSYQYRITLEKNAFTDDRAWHFFKPLDIQTMNDAAALLLGKNDFSSFSKVNTDVNNFICDITTARWRQEKKRLEFTISANRFLRGMVRAIVGTLIDVGQGKITVAEFGEIIQRKDRREAGQNVPPYGLYLVSVRYPDNIFLPEGNES